MGLLNETGAAPAMGTAANKAPAKAEGKKNAAEYQREKKAKMAASAKRILDNKSYALDATDKAFLEALANPSVGRGGGNFGTPVINKLFGEKLVVGAKVTLQEVFDKTYKGKAQMDSMMKKWKEKNGVTVEFVFNKDKPALSTYTIKNINLVVAQA